MKTFLQILGVNLEVFGLLYGFLNIVSNRNSKQEMISSLIIPAILLIAGYLVIRYSSSLNKNDSKNKKAKVKKNENLKYLFISIFIALAIIVTLFYYITSTLQLPNQNSVIRITDDIPQT